MCERPFGAAATTSPTNDNCRRRERCPALVLSAKRIRSGKRIVANRMAAEPAMSAVREVVKAFEELVPTSVLKDRALAIAIELRHPAYDCFYLALAERSTSPLITADERLIRRCADTPFEKLVQSL